MAASLELAITAIRSGRKEEGRQLLNLLIQQNPNDEMAWLWMSSVVNTDEQRARCLYHVLAINPDNQLAQRGLKILGIVVTDSRPVKIPRDSQPIKIPKPTPTSQPAFPSVAQVEQAVPVEERRPFRLDPEAIVAELPFTPVTRPFAAATDQSHTQQPETPSQPVPVIQASIEPGAAAQSPIDTKPLPDPSKPVSMSQPPQPGEQAAAAPSEPVVPVQVNPAITQAQPPSAPVPVVQPGTAGLMAQAQPASEPVQQVIQPNTGLESAPVQPQTPSEPVPVVQPNPGLVQSPQLETGQLRPASEPVPVVQQTFYPQYPLVDPMARQETRPTQPLPAPYSNVTQVMSQQPQAFGPGHQLPPPAVGHSNATMGMPTQNFPVQNQPQPMPGVHSNPTMGFAPAQGNGQGQHPSEPMPVIHSNSTMPMPQYAQPQYQYQPAMAQGYAIHSNATMAMPLGYDPLAALSAPLYKDYRGSNPPRSGARRNKQVQEEDEGDEVNILAVIIFGSLSVTALGGLGMLILLMFTTA